MAAINRSTDMTTGSIWKRMVSFAVPVFLGNLCQQLYNTVDSVVVGNFVGKEALAAVGSVGPVINMLIGFFNGFGRCGQQRQPHFYDDRLFYGSVHRRGHRHCPVFRGQEL